MSNAYVDDSNIQREDAYSENGLTIPLLYYIIVTVYSETVIDNM